ncbi:MAG: 4Fe-4S cluster-binding domain-containing protein, partial [Myxococcales bacterium]|nr:4Fe-4S cluster-binding domain-containing protein [Myxococcales bacterium]
MSATRIEAPADGDGEAIAVALVVPATEAEGPGRRYALWVQGCPMRCPGCCNPEMLEFRGGARRRPAALVTEAIAADVDGVSLLGGE